ncbi:hypothetical protein BpHYR1_011882 [Brachionus plicatilis]|uniref:Uncharacterized protein n=1 Tax=Brachionus plicatilis TaxID=10195 RepID=A0A3M7RQD4_BRAPC|nr:hypothetical protein BpHYR1_011882 [Brachionus plicatilis]
MSDYVCGWELDEETGCKGVILHTILAQCIFLIDNKLSVHPITKQNKKNSITIMVKVMFNMQCVDLTKSSESALLNLKPKLYFSFTKCIFFID